MNLQIIKMVIGILGMILFGILIVRVLLRPVENNKLAVLSIGREKNGKKSNNNSVKKNNSAEISTKSKTSFEKINQDTLEEIEDETELLQDETELLQDNDEILDYTELINSCEEKGIIDKNRGDEFGV